MGENEGMKTRQTERDDEMVRSAIMEPSTLQWPGDRQTGGHAGAHEEEGAGLQSHPEKEEPVENKLPEKAAQVFTLDVLPSPSPPTEHEALWEMEPEKSPFLGPRGVQQDYNQQVYQYEWTRDTPPSRCGQCCPSRDTLKMGVSLMTSALFFPFLVWGGFVFLPFDAPLMDGAPLRLIYTLRCSVFAATPIILGEYTTNEEPGPTGMVLGCSNAFGEVELQEVSIHRHFISESTSLFMIYFLQLIVMAMYLSQEQLKLVPLLTIVCLFCASRLVYWVAAAFGSSIRGFGFGLSFLPSLTMVVANIYFIFTVEARAQTLSRVALSQVAHNRSQFVSDAFSPTGNIWFGLCVEAHRRWDMKWSGSQFVIWS
uniref:Transmembrane protein 79b n=1 Tax=Monopterus albus TaxID=43700 RepID=A0A3Q3JZ14_MONAL